jgi:hypothetical protein
LTIAPDGLARQSRRQSKAKQPRKRAPENTEIPLPRIPTKIGEIRGQVFSVVSMHNSVAFPIAFGCAFAALDNS